MERFELYNAIFELIKERNKNGINVLISRAEEKDIPTDVVLSGIYGTIVECVSTYLTGLSKYELIEEDDKINMVPISLKKALKMELKSYNDIYISNNCSDKIEALFEAYNDIYAIT